MNEESKNRIVQGAIKSAELSRQKKQERIDSFIKECLCCNEKIPYEKRRNKFCSQSCNAIYNNTKRGRIVVAKPKAEKIIFLCQFCNQAKSSGTYRYCSHACHIEAQYQENISKWRNGDLSGLNSNGVVTNYVKKYLMLKYNSSCSVCGWSKINPHTGKVPLVADHIDGNWKNNTEDNLRLLCGCCNSLTSTFGGANRGNGRTLNGNLR